MRLIRTVAVVAGLLLAPSVALCAEPHLALVRVESLDALMADVERLAALAGREMTGETLMAQLGAAAGGADLSWLDTGKPWVLFVSMSALVQGPQALVMAAPVSDQKAALEALKGQFLDQSADEDGVRMLDSGRDMPLATVFRDGYLVSSPSRETALGFRPEEYLARGDLPPGSVAVDFFLEAVAPMALAGLETGRTMLEQQLAETPEEFLGEGGEEDWEEEEWEEGEDGEWVEEESVGDREEAAEDPDEASAEEMLGASQENEWQEAESEENEWQEELAAPELGAAALSAMLDLYMDLLRNLISNASRLQMSLELGEDHLLVHQRVVPVAGSTLDGLLAAQSGGLPELARLIEPDDAGAVVTAGQVSLTPAFVIAAKEFMIRYRDTMVSLLDELEGTSEQLPGGALLRTAMHDVDRWPDCYRGDFAAAIDFGPESMSSLQAVGIRDAELCQELIDGMVAAMAAHEGDAPLLETAPEALIYKGVRAVRYQIDMGGMVPEIEDEELAMPAWARGELVSYSGIKDDLMLSSSGPDAETAFRRLVDRIDSAPAEGASAGGLTAERFAPLTVGPGVFATIDFRSFAESMPEEAGDEAAQLFAEISESGPMLYGLHMEPGALHAQFALPLGFLGAVSQIGVGSEVETPPTEAED